MKVSVIVPVGDEAQWQVCRQSISDSITAYRGEVEFEILPCYDLEHKGAYIARNDGLRRATGDWLAWVDCDDTVEPGWASEIVSAIATHPDCDMVVFGIMEERDGRCRCIYSPREHEEDGQEYARWMISGLGMPHWLWHKVFKRGLWDGVQFEGRVKQDYYASLQVLPRLKRVCFIPQCLYRYVRHGHGLSNYVQKMDYDAACKEFLALIEKLPVGWQYEAKRGMGLMLTDVILHDKSVTGANKYLRPYFWQLLTLKGMTFRFRVKSVMAALMLWK